jgi:hypothetical protein
VSDWHKFDFQRDYYVQVETVRHETLGITGKLRPVAEACRVLAGLGGLVWIVGGDTSELSSPRKGKRRRYNVDCKGNTLRFRQAENGTVYVLRLVEHAETIESRYDEAVRIARQDENVKFAWDNMVRDRCGLPRFPSKRWVIGHPPIVINLAELLQRLSPAS